MSILSSTIRAAATVSLFATVALAQAPPTTPPSDSVIGAAVPGRFIVTYKSGAVPAAPRIAGAKLVERADHIGVAIVEAPPGTADAVRKQIAADPAVESIVEDRVVTAHAITVRDPNAAPVETAQPSPAATAAAATLGTDPAATPAHSASSPAAAIATSTPATGQPAKAASASATPAAAPTAATATAAVSLAAAAANFASAAVAASTPQPIPAASPARAVSKPVISNPVAGTPAPPAAAVAAVPPAAAANLASAAATLAAAAANFASTSTSAAALPPAVAPTTAKASARTALSVVAPTTPPAPAPVPTPTPAPPPVPTPTPAPVPTPAPTPVVPTGSPLSDTLYNSPQGWAQRTVGGYGTAAKPGPWNATTGAHVRIAVLDSGVDANHSDISPNLALNVTEVDKSAASGIPSACDDGSPADQEGHGTWAASLAAGAAGPNTGAVAGVAPDATLLNIKVLERLPAAPTAGDPSGCIGGQAAGLLSWVIQGIDDAVADRADVISMSLGTLVDVTTGDGAGLKTTFDHVTHAAEEAGVVIIAAAGNDGVDLNNQQYVELPAQSRDVLAVVGATNPNCAENLTAGATCAPGPVTTPYYSNYGAPLNALAAPAGSYPSSSNQAADSGWIWGACSSGEAGTIDGLPTDPNHSMGCFNLGHIPYVEAMGTSASAPLVAGAAALVRAVHPTWDAATVVEALRTSATSVSSLPVPEVNVATLLTPAASATPAPVVPLLPAPAPLKPASPTSTGSHHITATGKQ